MALAAISESSNGGASGSTAVSSRMPPHGLTHFGGRTSRNRSPELVLVAPSFIRLIMKLEFVISQIRKKTNKIYQIGGVQCDRWPIRHRWPDWFQTFGELVRPWRSSLRSRWWKRSSWQFGLLLNVKQNTNYKTSDICTRHALPQSRVWLTNHKRPPPRDREDQFPSVWLKSKNDIASQ